MRINVIDCGKARMVAVQNGFSILYNGDEIGQRFYISESVEEINEKINSGEYTVIDSDGNLVETETNEATEADYQEALAEMGVDLDE